MTIETLIYGLSFLFLATELGYLWMMVSLKIGGSLGLAMLLVMMVVLMTGMLAVAAHYLPDWVFHASLPGCIVIGLVIRYLEDRHYLDL